MDVREERNERKPQRNHDDISPIVLAGARTGASERQVIAIANATLESQGVNLAQNPSKIISKSKYHAAKVRVTGELADAAVPSAEALFFDGKRFPTLHNDEVDELYYSQSQQTDDHYVVADGTRQTYLGEFVASEGTGEAIAEGVLDFVTNREGLDINDISILGGDSCNTNTGSKGGAIAQVEKKTGKTFQRFICLLHLIELLLRHMVGEYVGGTSGPKSFATEFGKQLVNFKQAAVTTFKRIPCDNFPQVPPEIIMVV